MTLFIMYLKTLADKISFYIIGKTAVNHVTKSPALENQLNVTKKSIELSSMDVDVERMGKNVLFFDISQ